MTHFTNRVFFSIVAPRKLHLNLINLSLCLSGLGGPGWWFGGGSTGSPRTRDLGRSALMGRSLTMGAVSPAAARLMGGPCGGPWIEAGRPPGPPVGPTRTQLIITTKSPFSSKDSKTLTFTDIVKTLTFWVLGGGETLSLTFRDYVKTLTSWEREILTRRVPHSY